MGAFRVSDEGAGKIYVASVENSICSKLDAPQPPFSTKQKCSARHAWETVGALSTEAVSLCGRPLQEPAPVQLSIRSCVVVGR